MKTFRSFALAFLLVATWILQAQAGEVSTGALAANAKDWRLEAWVYRDGSNTQRCYAKGWANGAVVLEDYTTATETDSGAITIKATGEATANDDVTNTLLIVKFEQ